MERLLIEMPKKEKEHRLEFPQICDLEKVALISKGIALPNQVYIGRSEMAEIRINSSDHNISLFHLLLEERDQGVYAVNLGRTGTILVRDNNSSYIPFEGTRINSEDILVLGVLSKNPQLFKYLEK